MSKSARFSVLYTKYMKQTYKDGMYKILKEKKKRKQKSLILISPLASPSINKLGQDFKTMMSMNKAQIQGEMGLGWADGADVD